VKKISLLFLVFGFSSLVCSAQEIEWQNTIGGSDYDLFTSVEQTADGGCILGGISVSGISGDKTENCIGDNDYWIVKTDSLGNIEWENTIGGTLNDNLYSIKQTSDGGYICGGNSLSYISGDKTENCMGDYDYWIVKLNSNGSIQWQNTIGGNSADFFISIVMTADGGYICGGHSWSGSSGDKTENSNGANDYWIVKLDSAGNIQWQNTMGGDDEDYLTSMFATADGGCVCCGRSRSGLSGDKTEINFGFDDYWVVKLDSAGIIQWENTIAGDDDDIPESVIQTSDGGYIVGGSSFSNISFDKTENRIGSIDCWIVKLDTAGIIQWQNTIGGSAMDRTNSILQTADGGYVCAGGSWSDISGDKTVNCLNSIDCWIFRLDSTGTIQWQNNIGTSEHESEFCVSHAADGGYFLGMTSTSDISGDKSENAIGDKDYWVLKLTNKFNSITGKLFIDGNSNGMQDAGETGAGNKTIREINTGRFNFSNQNGGYAVSVLDSGNFSVSPDLINYYNTLPANHTAYFSGINQTDSLNDFALQPSGVFNDLCVTITQLQAFRPGFDANYMINYENVGTTTLNGTVIFFADANVVYVSSTPIATSVTMDSVVWNVGILAPYQTGSIIVTVHVNNGAPIGALINSSVEIDPVTGDANTACNYNAGEVFVTGSYDPNAILVDRDSVFTTELSSLPYLNYTIYFQNTGNDTAFNARVLNNIPTRLDINSFEFIASSHPVNLTYSAPARLMTFTFDNILLPDIIANEPGSHGFIRYRIKPKTTLVAGNKIYNRAFIYFDFNASVPTNYALTEIVLPTGIGGQMAESKGQLAVYPNPAGDELIVNSRHLKEKGTIRIFDLFGREVYQLETRNQEPETKIDVSRFSQGVYFVELEAGNQVLRGKFLKE